MSDDHTESPSNVHAAFRELVGAREGDPSETLSKARSFHRSLFDASEAVRHELGAAIGATAHLVGDEATGDWPLHNLGGPRPAEVIEPRDALDIVARVGGARHVQAVGSGWSYSRAGYTPDTLVEMQRGLEQGHATFLGDPATDLELLSPAAQQAFADGRLARVPAGATIADVYRRIGDARALLNAPGFSELTLVGVLSCGGHGSGTWIGPLAEQVRSLSIIGTDDGGSPKQFRVEASDGPTDRRAFEGRYGHGKKAQIELVQDDSVFAACLVARGALGVIVDVTLEVRSGYRLREERTLLTLPEILARLPQLLEDQGPSRTYHSVEVWMNPYAVLGSPHAVLGTRAWTTDPIEDHRGYGVTHASRGLLRLIGGIMYAFPWLTPYLLQVGLETTQGTAVLEAPDALDFGPTNHADVAPTSAAFPLDDPGARLLEIAGYFEQRAEQGHLTSPVGIRFTGASRAWFAPAFESARMMVEVPPLRVPGFERRAEQVADAFAAWARERGARPHWGLRFDLDGQSVRDLYPEKSFRQFAAARAVLDPAGRFANAFTKLLGEAHPTIVTARPAHPAAAPVVTWSQLFEDVHATLTRIPGEQAIVERIAQGRPLVLRAGGSSLHTQALGGVGSSHDHGILRGLDHFAIKRDGPLGPRVEAGASVTWGRVVDEALASGLVPRVVPTTPLATIGGSLSANSIGEASRVYGHESDGLIALRVLLVRGRDGAPEIRDIPLPTDDPETAELVRGVVGGFGLVAVILGATYKLVEVDVEARALTRVYKPERPTVDPFLAMLEMLPPSDEDATSFRSGTIFYDGHAFRPFVVSTRFARPTRPHAPSFPPYAGPTALRKVAELLEASMVGANIAERIEYATVVAAARDDTEFSDPVRGYLFLMEGNQVYKDTLARRFPALVPVFGTTVDNTWVLPDAEAATTFLHDVIAALTWSGRKLMPVLVEVVWVPADEQLLSSSYRRPGFAVSVLFQGPGIYHDRDQGPLFRGLHEQVFGVLEGLAARALALGGNVRLAKNVFVGRSPRTFVRQMLGAERFDRFQALRAKYGAAGVLTSRFADELFGAP